jgi:transcriptional regulator with XRE-family HTH domain
MARARRPSPFPTSQPPAIPAAAAATRPAEKEPISALAKRVGDNIRERRRARRYSSSALSRASGMSRAMLSRIERGIVSASLTTLARVAEALDVDVEELVATRVLADSSWLHPLDRPAPGTSYMRPQPSGMWGRSPTVRSPCARQYSRWVQIRRAIRRPSAKVPS